MNNNNISNIVLADNKPIKYGSYVVFIINNNRYAINIRNVPEIINMPKLEIPEKTPIGIIGVFNYKGRIIKAIDLCPFLGFSTNNFSVSNQIIIANLDDEYFAIHTDKIENVIQFELNNIQKIPYNTENSILKEVCKTEDDSINIIDIKSLSKKLNDNQNTISTTDYSKKLPNDEKSLQVLKFRAEQYKISEETYSYPINVKTTNQYILFTIDNQNYYLDLKRVKEFISSKRLNITALPYTQDYIKGIINIRGEFLIVIDMKRFLNTSATDETTGSKLIIAEGQNFNIAFIVDEIKSIQTLKNIPLTSINTNNSYILSEIIEDNILYSILNFEKIINDERLYINIK